MALRRRRGINGEAFILKGNKTQKQGQTYGWTESVGAHAHLLADMLTEQLEFMANQTLDTDKWTHR